MSIRFKRFPPGGQLLLPLDSRRAALAGLALYPACRPRAVWAQRGAGLLIGLFGPAALPGESVPGPAATQPEMWEEVALRWTEELGPFDAYAVFRQRQASRAGMAVLLLRDGTPLAFVKLREAPAAELAHEDRVLEMVGRSAPGSFQIAQPLGRGSAAGWAYLALRPLPAGTHRVAAHPPLRRITAELQGALGSLKRPEGVPGHWVPMHGDFTPWNLRTFAGDRLFLVDWEDAGWGPPGADELLYRVTAGVLRGGRPPRVGPGLEEAARFWRDRLVEKRSRAEAAGDPDIGFLDEVLEVLDGAA